MDLITKKHVEMILQGKYAFVGNSDDVEAITKFINERYSIPLHLSEQKTYLVNWAIAMRKSLSEQIIKQINRI